MKLGLNCREVTRLVLHGQDERLAAWDRWRLRLHWRACEGCRRFSGQARLMQRAVARWRTWREAGDEGDV